jgi:hypothetical protein
MNIHELLDRWTIQISRLFFARNRYFRDGVESPSLAAHLMGVALPPLHLAGEGTYTWTANTLAGPLDAACRIAQWRGDGYPTIIYHHGTNETPYDRSFTGIFPHEKVEIPANLIIVRAPFGDSLGAFLRGIRLLANYAAMLAVSVRLIEALIQHCRERGAPAVAVSGISLGGFVTNLHHAHVNSASVYAPLFAGAAMGTLFTQSYYRKLVAPSALAQADAIREVLNFEDAFTRVDVGNVFPLLGRYDQYIDYERQKRVYGEQPLTLLERGHITGALAYATMRRHVLERVAPGG